ncbi:transmembrane protease serine 11A-like [Teleopsis dalmanni]|uniref:transmembrane protease serine 11A-like n=1 Tax=Teleopsis dalmanni TaxID=139649 RepID=UPI0018CDD8CE|nr:transmembrane protease serine 11A-like [Teleopsis dalmanni]
MIKMKALNIILIFLYVAVFSILNSVVASEVEMPTIACPDLFRYVIKPNETYAVVTVPSSFINGANVHLQVIVHQYDLVNQEFSLLPFKSQEETLSNILARKSVEYRFSFPSPQENPKLSKIVVNGETICFDDDYIPPYNALEGEFNIELPINNTVGDTSIEYVPPSISQLNNCFSFVIYEEENNKTFARIKIPNYYFEGGTPEVKVDFAQNKMLTSGKYALFTYKSLDETILDVMEGKPVLYRFQFPDQTEIPVIREIQVNSKPICANKNPRVGSMKLTGGHTMQLPLGYNNLNIYTDNESDDNNDKSKDNRTCGREVGALTPFISFGNEINNGQVPWLASIFQNNDENLVFICGGSLISKRIIITAAHCFQFQTLPADLTLVKLGGSNTTDDTGVLSFGVEKIIIHPEYRNDFIPDADIALLYLNSSITFTDFISPICLWNGDTDLSKLVNKIGYVAGFGSTENGTISETSPRIAYARIVSEIECVRSSNKIKSIISPRTFCAGNRDLSGPCTGDSGSGIMIRKNRHWSLRGVVSIGETFEGQCNLGEFVIYCDLAKHLDWINNHILD